MRTRQFRRNEDVPFIFDVFILIKSHNSWDNDNPNEERTIYAIRSVFFV